MKRLISVLLTLAMLAAMIPAAVIGTSAEDTTPQGYWTDAGNYDISWCKTLEAADANKTVTVGGKHYYVKGDWTNQTYHFTKPEQLAGLSYLSNQTGDDLFKGDTFYIDADLDLGAHYWVPISKSSKLRGSLIGNVNGGSATISNMTIDSSAKKDGSVGLVGQFGGGWIKNLRLENAKITAHSFTVGSFVGWQNGNVGSGQPGNQGGYENLYADTTIVLTSGQGDQYDDVGGIVGIINSCNANNPATIIKNCVFTGTISAPMGDNVGGIIGLSQYDYQQAPVISECVVISEKMECGKSFFKDEWNVGFGGIAGNIYANQKKDAEGNVITTDFSTVTNCYVAANMIVLDGESSTKTFNVGGIVGASCSQPKTYENCQFDGVMIGTAARKGGILGRYLAPATIKNCVVTGAVLNSAATQSAFVGTATEPTVTGSFAALQTYDRYSTDAKLQSQITESTDLTALIGDGTVWTKDAGALYPMLAIAKPYLNDSNRHLSVLMSGADFSWFRFSGKKTLTDERELTALSILAAASGTKSEAFLRARDLQIKPVLVPLLNGLFDATEKAVLLQKTAGAIDTEKVVGVYAQTSQAAQNGVYSVRFVAEIVGTDWASAGFDLLVSYTGADGVRKCSRLTEQNVTVCYTSVHAGDNVQTAPEGHYYLVFVLHSIPASNGNTTFTISAHVENADGASYANAGSITFDATGNCKGGNSVTGEEIDLINSRNYKNPWKTGIAVKGEDGKEISLREVTIDIPGNGTPIEIFQISDVHFNAFYEGEADFVKASYTEWGGKFGDNADIITAFKRCMNYAAGADRVILTGDLVNFYSRANYDIVEKYVFQAAENINDALSGKVIPTAGNHECTYPDRRSLAQFDLNYTELKALYSKYGFDLDYTSQVIDGRVMVVVLDNASRYDAGGDRYSQAQVDNLTRDIAIARENGYTMLLFGHIPMPTKNTDGNGYFRNYDPDAYTDSHPTAKAFYELVTNNADVIRGIFTGHFHEDNYVEIVAKTADGKPAYIPQYVLANMRRLDGKMNTGDGMMTRIILK